MIRYVLVDDNHRYIEELKRIIISSMANTKCDFNIICFDDYTKELKTFIEQNRENTVYLLDLELPNGSGVEIARYIRNECCDWRNPIIICTAYSSLSYEIKSLRLQLLEFVSKNTDTKKNMEELIDICLTMFEHIDTYKFTYKSVDYTIPFKKINYFQREGRKVRIDTIDKEYYQSTTIAEIRKQLPNCFVISSKGIIINTKNIKTIDWRLLKVTFNNDEFAYIISKTHKKDLSKI